MYMIYLDNSATTKPYNEVLDSFVKVSTDFYGNPSSLHGLGMKAEQILTQARENSAKQLGCKPSEVIFTSGGSEGNSLAIKGSALFNKGRGNHIITTGVEHPSVTEACKQLEQHGFTISYIQPNNNGIISVDDIKREIRDDTILISVIHINNEIGAIQPIEDIGNLLRQYPKILFHVDHVQGVGKVNLDFAKAGIDLCTISGHKFHGLKGTGILYVRFGVSLTPLISGGAQENNFRSGTESIGGAVALAKALRLTVENTEKTVHRMNKIKERYITKLSKLGSISINTPSNFSAPHIINFSINGLKSEVFVHMLEEYGIYVSTTSACSSKKKAPSKTLLAMGKDEKTATSSIRISLSYLNKLEEVDTVIAAIADSISKLEKIMR